MALLIGEYEATIDSKRRLAICSAIRDQVVPDDDGENFILVLGPDRHLWLYPDRYYRRLLATMKRSPLPSRHQRKMDLFFAMARILKPDAQGRVVLPEKTMQRAMVSNEVTLVGNNDHIEIWPREDWERRVEEELASYGEMLYEAADLLAGESPEE